MRQQGFTLIELVMVIVILGILAAVAIPNYVNLEDQAGAAGAQGVAGAISSASAINLAACKAGSANCTQFDTANENCTDFAALLSGGAIPTGYTISGTVDLSTAGATGACTVTHTGTGQTANAVVHSTA